jgi:hypothetical protein
LHGFLEIEELDLGSGSNSNQGTQGRGVPGRV